MIVSLPTGAALDNYVQVAIMETSRWGEPEWDPGDCECGGPPPPEFMVPPPPRPPPFYPMIEDDFFQVVEDECDDTLSCPALLGARDQRPPPSKAHLAVVIVSASTLVILILVAAVILCRIRGRGRAAKGCTELSGAIIYDDLPSAPSIVPARTRPRFKPVPIDSEEVMGMTMGVHLYTPEPRSHPPSEHLYQSISSGSETCSYSTSEATGQDGRALLRLHHHRAGGGGGGMGGGMGGGGGMGVGGVDGGIGRCSPSLVDTDSEDEHLASQGILMGVSDNDTPSTSPARSRYYCSSAPPPQTSSSPRSSDYESVYYVGGIRRGRPPTPQERGLPPLPSRTDRFRMYFSVERGQQYHMAPLTREGSGNRTTSNHRRHTGHRPRLPPEAEPLYENLT
ncbi:uncharacterized protein [Palaemon carinicauda]|uniref:uncharacterized protein n=1 Tax=Palaemon carinicauda TaxID=392227 RepID=UPI0035B61A1A